MLRFQCIGPRPHNIIVWKINWVWNWLDLTISGHHLQGSRDYNIGERPDPRALQVAEELGLKLPDGVARVFDCHSDIVLSDLLVVMDKVMNVDKY